MDNEGQGGMIQITILTDGRQENALLKSNFFDLAFFLYFNW